MKLVLTVALALALAVLSAGAMSAPAASLAAADRLPDLGMAHPKELSIERTPDGRRLLRFSSVVVNVGAGRFEAHGVRPSAGAATMSVSQRVFDSAGGHRDRATGATMTYAGDGHSHWHVRDLERFELRRLDGGAKVGTGAKHGFCFFDNYRFGSALSPYYTIARGACGGSSSLQVKMGLSRGWGDIYHYSLPDQYIDVTGLTAGRYRLRATADADGRFLEANESNNLAWIDLQLQSDRVSVVRLGPAAQPIG